MKFDKFVWNKFEHRVEDAMTRRAKDRMSGVILSPAPDSLSDPKGSLREFEFD